MAMKLSYTWGALVGCTLVSAAFANGDVIKQTQNSSNWAMQAGDMYNQRYSKLKQINKENVKNLQVAWTFSTGVLRGHEGSPLVIGDTMYLHTPFPNKVFAIDLDDAEDQVEVRAEAGSGGDPADVLRHRQPRPRLRRGQDLPAAGRHARWSRSTRRPARWSGRSRTAIRRSARSTPTRRTSSRTR